MRIASLERRANSGGSPVWSVMFDDGSVALTEPGAQIAYSIDNSELRDVDVDVAYNESGRIVGMTPA